MKIPLLLTTAIFFPMHSFAQTALSGDGFGGRLWYKPTSYSVGSYSAYTVCGDSNQLFAWGSNKHGELGIDNSEGVTTPVEVPNMNNIYYFSAGYLSAAVKNDGSGWVWGSEFGKPRKIMNDVKYVDAGARSATFIHQNGTVWSIGFNFNGCFGQGVVPNEYYTTPQKMDYITNAVRVANGLYTTTILLDDGTVKACGSNVVYGLGQDNVYLNNYTPVEVEGLHDIVSIAACKEVNLALDKYGNVFTWGVGKANQSTEVRRIPELSNIVAISGRNDGYQFLALDSAGQCFAWGHNPFGGVGIANYTTQDVPKLVAEEVIDVLAGESFCYIVKKDYSLWGVGCSNGGSIWLTRPNVKTNQYVQIPLQNDRIAVCSPRVSDFSNMSIDTFRICQGDVVRVGNKLYTQSGTYYDTLVNRMSYDSIQITTLIVNHNNLFQDTIVKHFCEGEEIKLGSRRVSESYTYIDSLSNHFGCDSIITYSAFKHPNYSYEEFDTFCFNASIIQHNMKYELPGSYNINYRTKYGCDSSFTLHLHRSYETGCEFITYIPTAFTPNNDGINDYFSFVNKYDVPCRLRIYSRWGEVIYVEESIKPAWSGKSDNFNYPVGVYLYEIETFNHKDSIDRKYYGTVSLFR